MVRPRSNIWNSNRSFSWFHIFIRTFGALLETAGGGKYFLDLLCNGWKKQRGPAKAAILGSGMTGMISGSSIANTVTAGTFTIPIMKNGFSGKGRLLKFPHQLMGK